MTTTAVQKVPDTWDDARDVPFFRITARLFPPEFCLCASVLLASYEDDTLEPGPVTHAERSTCATPTTSDNPEPARERMPVRVRRTR